MRERSRAPSLRRGLFIWLIAPVGALALVSALAAWVTAYRFANQVYDRSISDMAVALSQLVRVEDDFVVVDLPLQAQMMLDSDQRDRIYYKVATIDGVFVAGHRGLPATLRAIVPGADPFCFDGALQGEPLRTAVFAPADGRFYVEIAETVNKRDVLALEIIASMLLPLIALVALGALGVWLGVARGLRPLTALAGDISGRSAEDLRPVDEARAPLEARPLTRALNGLFVRLGDALSTQRRFVADAAHQLRTPLTGLKTQAELALRSNDLATVRESLAGIVAATDRTSHLVNQLLALARTEPEGQVRLRRQSVDLARLMRDVTADWIPRALERGVDLGFEGRDTQSIPGDPTLLRELAGNLIDNAIAHSPPGAEVTVAIQQTPAGLELSVTDNGPGVPEAERERVFERFHRVLGSTVAGSGLGLAIVRQIAHGHGATASLEPGPGQLGTRVKVVFPPGTPAPQPAA